MKNISSALAADFQADCRTLARLWRIRRRDGVIIRLTDHDEDILYDETLDFIPPGTITPGTVAPGGASIPGSPTPTFQDDFSASTIDTSKWTVSNYTTANYAGGGSDVTFAPASVDLVSGCLRITLTQPTSSTSTGGEVVSVNSFGYGTYEWSMRASSTASLPSLAGAVKSGQISTGFTFYNNSETEIDCPEIEGRTPHVLEFTNWNVLLGDFTRKQFSSVTASFNPQDAFHLYKFVWSATRIDFYVDNVLVSSHTSFVPSHAASIIMSHYGTNSNTWGGLATVGVTRYLFFNSFKYWA